MKNFINSALLNKNRVLDPNKLQQKYFVNNSFESEYQEILSLTAFLDSNSTLKERIYCILNDVKSVKICPVCKTNPVNFKSSLIGYNTYCSTKCRSNDPMVKVKIKNTCQEKYGTDSFFSSIEFKEKSDATLLEKYGTTNLMLVPEIKSKVEDTNLQRYNSKYGFGSSIIQEKIKNTNIDRYGTTSHNVDIVVLENLKSFTWLQQELSSKPVFQIAQELKCSESYINKWARIHNLSNRVAKYSEEVEVSSYLTDCCGLKSEDLILNSFDVIGTGSGKLGRRQIDIFIPKNNLAIEINGLYYHQNNKTRHKEKLDLATDKQIKLIQFWDYQWNSKQDICKSIINNFIGTNKKIYARKCEIKVVSFQDYSIFMNNNHMHGVATASIRYGLYFDDILVSCIGFGRSRYSKKHSWELIRYANILNTNVVGGFSRLLNHFKSNNMGSIISYCDLMLFTGNMYEKSGFTCLGNTNPNFFYFKGFAIKSRESMQKHKLATILKDFDPELTANQNLLNNGWSKVWNCGNSIWELV
jgi:hypothetical protein